MALFQIRSFQSINDEYRQLTELISRHPSSKRLERLSYISGSLQDSADPLVETAFFRDIDQSLVAKTSQVLLDEINKNRGLAAMIEGDDDYEDEFDDEFRQQLVERMLSGDAETDEEQSVMVIASDPLELAPRTLARFMGGVHGMSIQDLFVSLENSESVSRGLDQEYARHEHLRTASIGLVAFAGALAGSLLAGKIKKR